MKHNMTVKKGAKEKRKKGSGEMFVKIIIKNKPP
jgi:hypothetical protein